MKQPIHIVHIRFPPRDSAEERRQLRARWTIVPHDDGFGVVHASAGEFGRFGHGGTWLPHRYETEAAAEAWIGHVVDAPREPMAPIGLDADYWSHWMAAPLTSEEQSAVDACETEKGEEWGDD